MLRKILNKHSLPSLGLDWIVFSIYCQSYAVLGICMNRGSIYCSIGMDCVYMYVSWILCVKRTFFSLDGFSLNEKVNLTTGRRVGGSDVFVICVRHAD